MVDCPIEDPPGYRPKLHFDAGVEKYFSRAFGVEQFMKICQALTCPSKYSCIRVNTLWTTRGETVRKLHEILKCNCSNSNCQKTGKSAMSSDEELEDILRSFSTNQQSPHELSAELGTMQSVPFLGLNLQDEEMGAGMLVSQIGRSSQCGQCFEHPLLDNVIFVRGDGPHQLGYGTMKEVVVSRKCAEAVLRGANVFVPGVLACSGHVEQEDLVAVSVAVEHLDGNGEWVVGVTRGTVLLSEHGDAQLNDVDRRNYYIGKGKAMLSRTGMFRELGGVAVEMIDRVYSLPPLHGVLKGEIFLQNLPSIVAAMVLDPKPGEHILDMCAAPGGKSTAIAILMKDKGVVVAIDRSHNKVMDIIRLAEEMKLKSIHAFKLDALKAVRREDSKCHPGKYENRQDGESLKCFSDSERLAASVYKSSMGRLEKSDGHGSESFQRLQELGTIEMPGKETREWKTKETSQYRSNAQARKESRKMRNGPGRSQNSGKQANQIEGFLPSSFDRVLLDPPCSALGLRPRLFAAEETLEGLRQHGTYQRRMFDQAVQLCRPGGIIVYSTCTINPGENEAVVRYALDTYSCLSLIPQAPRLGGPGLTGGHDIFDGVSYMKWLRDDEQHLVQRFDPSGPLDTIGFFIAKFKVESQG